MALLLITHFKKCSLNSLLILVTVRKKDKSWNERMKTREKNSILTQVIYQWTLREEGSSRLWLGCLTDTSQPPWWLWRFYFLG